MKSGVGSRFQRATRTAQAAKFSRKDGEDAQCPMPNAQCSMLNAQSLAVIPFHQIATLLIKVELV